MYNTVLEAIKQSIKEYKSNPDHTKENAFSMNIYYDKDDNTYEATVSFTADYNKTIMTNDSDDVLSIYNLEQKAIDMLLDGYEDKWIEQV